jgi:hypothetical protein
MCVMKPAEWLAAEELSDQAAAELIGCARSTVTRVRLGTHIFGRRLAEKWVRASGGAVSADELLGIAAQHAAQVNG